MERREKGKGRMRGKGRGRERRGEGGLPLPMTGDGRPWRCALKTFSTIRQLTTVVN